VSVSSPSTRSMTPSRADVPIAGSTSSRNFWVLSPNGRATSPSGTATSSRCVVLALSLASTGAIYVAPAPLLEVARLSGRSKCHLWPRPAKVLPIALSSICAARIAVEPV
jgi:hypothetical protein